MIERRRRRRRPRIGHGEARRVTPNLRRLARPDVPQLLSCKGLTKFSYTHARPRGEQDRQIEHVHDGIAADIAAAGAVPVVNQRLNIVDIDNAVAVQVAHCHGQRIDARVENAQSSSLLVSRIKCAHLQPHLENAGQARIGGIVGRPRRERSTSHLLRPGVGRARRARLAASGKRASCDPDAARIRDDRARCTRTRQTTKARDHRITHTAPTRRALRAGRRR
jgi:hypothetical protein